MNALTEAEIRAAVDAVLTDAKLPVSDEERARLESSYLVMKQMAASLRIPEVRYGDPALIYSATLGR